MFIYIAFRVHFIHTLLHKMSMFKLLGLSFWLYFGSSISSKTAVPIVNGTIRIKGSATIGITDEDFVCATMDWWPPTKCDYGTCSWGNASLLNLVLFLTNEINSYVMSCKLYAMKLNLNISLI